VSFLLQKNQTMLAALHYELLMFLPELNARMNKLLQNETITAEITVIRVK